MSDESHNPAKELVALQPAIWDMDMTHQNESNTQTNFSENEHSESELENLKNLSKSYLI